MEKLNLLSISKALVILISNYILIF